MSFITRKVLFIVKVIWCPQGHSLPWVFAPTGAEQDIPFARSCPCPPCRWCPAPQHREGRCGSRAGAELQGQAPSCAVLDRPSRPCRPGRSGSPAAPGIPNSQLLLSHLFRLELGLRVFGLSSALPTPPMSWSKGLACQWSLQQNHKG